MRDILETERQEEMKDKRFFITCGIIFLFLGLAFFCFTVILPAIETVNPVGNLIIIR